MNNMAAVDKNMVVETTIEREGLRFYDAESAPFQIYGVFKENGLFRRMPEKVAKSVSPNVYILHTNGAGGRVRFVTDSPYVAIKTEYQPYRASHFALTGSAGFDMYAEYNGETRYQATYRPPYDVADGYESVINFRDPGEKVVTINFPPYSSVSRLSIGLKEGTVLKKAPDYKIKKPVVYYGSSITQGACASRPGCSYESILSRRFDCDYINLGFSGSARAEDEMIDYIKGLEMSVFVMDYDHNAPSVDHLKNTHGKMFRAIRAAQPDLPIIILPRPKYYLTEAEKRRRELVYDTYQTAKEQGDENVYFIDGRKLMEIVGDDGLVDYHHPTDGGFFSMACAIGEVMGEIFADGF